VRIWKITLASDPSATPLKHREKPDFYWAFRWILALRKGPFQVRIRLAFQLHETASASAKTFAQNLVKIVPKNFESRRLKQDRFV
jgi:hypothetical protein